MQVKVTHQFYLNELLSALKLWHQDVLPVGQSGEWHTEASRGVDVGVFRKLLQQQVPHCPQQTEGRVEHAQRVSPGLFRRLQHINTELFWGGKRRKTWGLGFTQSCAFGLDSSSHPAGFWRTLVVTALSKFLESLPCCGGAVPGVYLLWLWPLDFVLSGTLSVSEPAKYIVCNKCQTQHLSRDNVSLTLMISQDPQLWQ